MAAVHFTAMPCTPYTAHELQGKPYFCHIYPCANDTDLKMSLSGSHF